MGVAIGWGLRASKRSTSNRRSDLEDVAIGGWMKGDTFSLDPRDEDASVDFAFDHAGPGLGVGSGLEDLCAGLDSPYGECALP